MHSLCVDAETFISRYKQLRKSGFTAYLHPEYGFDYKLSLYINKKLPAEKIQALKSALHRMEQEKTYDIYKANKSSGIVK